jgi:hypothetical protein
VLAFNLYFQYIGLNLQENQVHHSKERYKKQLYSSSGVYKLMLLEFCATLFESFDNFIQKVFAHDVMC